MIWLTWRQFRAQTIATAAVLALFAVALVLTGLHLAHLYNASGLPGCHPSSACSTFASNFVSDVAGSLYEKVLQLGLGVMYLVPAVVGMFWGAPLIARELETGTFRLAWNQSVTRTRWVAVKLGLVGLATLATVGVLGVLNAWSAGPYYQAAQQGHGHDSAYRLAPMFFGSQGVVPLGYAAFAFCLGVTAGLLIRRTIPAMAVALAGFGFVQLAWPIWVRPHLMTPVRETIPFDTSKITEIMSGPGGNQMIVKASVDKPGAWVLSNTTVNSAGRPFSGPATPQCQGQGIRACEASIARLHLRQLVIYQPGSRFWAFQWYETAIFAGVAVALAGFCVWWIRHRRLA